MDQKEDKNSLRLYLDTKGLNKNIGWNHCYTRTIDHLNAELHGSKYFILMGTKWGYWMIWLGKQTSLLTTFNTTWGKLRWIELPFSLSVSLDIFQERVDTGITMVPDVTEITD